ncbi:hypothetical protein DSL72_005660 [Monilinia vaccinii-corymbosi]|uniref:Glucose-methanol-choline oxidoreductase N-terminal domain-containing protein n=1 Tax=Monilinia vaccinii-corymbosi TaxID=61207 RepID=A0A8A3PFQ5_9HELO|nr:hypothetical protein DSL72_005660 [Monilinia vaccinii-corymbosi]
MHSDQGEDFIYVPLLAGIGDGAIGTKYDWNLTYSPQPAANNRSIAIPLGKVVGGGSCLNKMTFDIAGEVDYDRWTEVGGVGWNDLLPYFKKVRSFIFTNFTPPEPEIAKEWDIQTDPTAHGYKGYYARRSNSSRSTVIATKEVVLAAGAIHSPQLLQLSGIGDPSLLEQLGINTVVSLPGVGANFQDHPLLRSVTSCELLGPYSTEGVSAYAFIGTSSFTNKTLQIVSSASSITPASYLPSDVDPSVLVGYEAQYEILTRDLASKNVPIMEFIFSGGAVYAILQHPFSRGSVVITSTDPFTPPSTNPGFLSHQTDLLLLSAAGKYARTIMKTPAFAPLSPVEIVPGPSVQTEADFEAWVRSTINTTFHPSGSTSMMKRRYGGVVDSDYRVYGVQKLRVVDAGTFPMIQAAHLQATVYAMAERASDIIKRTYRGDES